MNPSRIRWALPILVIAVQLMMLRVGLTVSVINNIWLLIIILVLAKLEKQIWDFRKDLTEMKIHEEVRGK
jgi:hypothetical protein